MNLWLGLVGSRVIVGSRDKVIIGSRVRVIIGSRVMVGSRVRFGFDDVTEILLANLKNCNPYTDRGTT